MANENLKIDEELAEALSSIKQQKFVMFYVENGFIGTAAAEAAGYSAPAASAYDCLKNPVVKEQIKRYAALCTRNAGESRETIIAREVNWASSDIGDYFETSGDVTGALKPLKTLTKAQRQCVKKLSWNRNGPVLELHDPMRANRNLAEYNGLTAKEDQALNADDAASLIAAAMERMDELDHTPATPE